MSSTLVLASPLGSMIVEFPITVFPTRTDAAMMCFTPFVSGGLYNAFSEYVSVTSKIRDNFSLSPLLVFFVLVAIENLTHEIGLHDDHVLNLYWERL